MQRKESEKNYVLHGYSIVFMKIISDTAVTSSAPDKYIDYIIGSIYISYKS